MTGLPAEPPKRRSRAVAAFATLLTLGFLVLCESFVLDALLTGRTKFPAKYNDTYVTWAANPGWFVASLVAWLLMSAVMAYAFLICWKGLVRSLHL